MTHDWAQSAVHARDFAAAAEERAGSYGDDPRFRRSRRHALASARWWRARAREYDAKARTA